MPYYGAGDYYRAGGYYRAGDYYRAGGLFGGIAKFIGGAAKGFISGGPIGAIKGGAMALVPQAHPTQLPIGIGLGQGFGPYLPPTPEPGVTGIVHRLVPGGKSGYGRLRKDGQFTDRRRPRMNVTNVRALRRAGRRVRGFLKIASRLGALPVSRGGGKKLFRRKRK